MASIALFHSVLGVRPGVQDAAARLRARGHEVLVVDQYDGRSFDDYATAVAYQEVVGFPALMQAALEASAAEAGQYANANARRTPKNPLGAVGSTTRCLLVRLSNL
jgi:dienelactone hydrolase